MSGLTLKRFTGFAFGHDNQCPEMWINANKVAFVEQRIVKRGRAEVADGTRIYFDVDGGVLDVREPIGLVVSTLQSGRGGACKDCYTPLPQSWMSVCDDCREHRYNGVDHDYEDARAEVVRLSTTPEPAANWFAEQGFTGPITVYAAYNWRRRSWDRFNNAEFTEATVTDLRHRDYTLVTLQAGPRQFGEFRLDEFRR
jgi:hypothetical protein